MYQATEIVPMEIPTMIPMALCHFCPYQSGELEMRIHFIQSHYDHVSKFWKVCKFCARYYPTDLEFKNHTCVLQSRICGVCGKNFNSKSNHYLYQHMRSQHLDVIKVRKKNYEKYFRYIGIEIYALSFYRSQNVSCRYKFFEPAQKFDCL